MSASTHENPEAASLEELAPAVNAILGANPFVGVSPHEIVRTLGQFAVRTLSNPELIGRRFVDFTAEMLRIATGESALSPDPGDKRFADPAFAENPFYHRLMQSYLAGRGLLHALVEAGVPNGDDWKTAAQERFAVTLLTEALAPTNMLPGNPAALKRAFDTGGSSLVAGLANFIDDLLNNGGMPSQVDKRAFGVGRNLAMTPGAVVHRGELCEVLQFKPATAEVYERPVMLVPPQINKYYIMDLAPHRSMAEYAVARGVQFFAVSWRNPGPEHSGWGLDDYVGAAKEAAAIVAQVSGSPDINLLGVCAGGITSSLLLGHLAAQRDRRVNAASLIVTMLDSSQPSMTGMFATEEGVRAAVCRSQEKGVLDAASIARLFAWMRPNDLVWSYWVNNYLMGKTPAPFDILYWNADSTNLPARLHEGFLDLLLHNRLVAGNAEILSTPIKLHNVTCDMYVVAGQTDHICAWRACHEAAQLFGGETNFVLNSSGHVQSLVAAPGNPKAKYFTNSRLGDDPDYWLGAATEHQGTWWDDWLDWLGRRSGAKRPAAEVLGSPHHPPLEPAPGTYVFQRP